MASIDPATYQSVEKSVKSVLNTWELAQIHYWDMESAGFPHQFKSIQEIFQLLNIMQENRFDPYMLELKGLNDEDLHLFIEALRSYIKMVLQLFPLRKVNPPLSNMLTSLAVYNKLRGYHPNFETVLEVGPGCGNLAFFLRQHPALKNYTSTDSTEGYYLLQSEVNHFLWGEFFREYAFSIEQYNSTYTECPELEVPVFLFPKQRIKSEHYPWWKLNDIADRENYYDIVTSNANLMEFSYRALLDYINLIKKVMKPEGALIVQCFGGPLQRSDEDVKEILFNEGLGAILISPEARKVRYPEEAEEFKYFALRNGVFVKEGHPEYVNGRTLLETKKTDYVNSCREVLSRMYFYNSDNRKKYNKNDIIQMISDLTLV